MKKFPVIDVAALHDDNVVGLDEVANQISAACRHAGVFQVVNHGMPSALIQRVWTETERFFALPRDTKLAIARTEANSRGYYDRELTKNARDLKEVFDFGTVPRSDLSEDHPDNRSVVGDQNQWPSALPDFKRTMQAYFEACERLALQLLESFCRGLDLPPQLLHPHFTSDHTSFVRLNYYPLDDPLSEAEAATVSELGDMALQHHTDAGALTILLQDDVGGLQVLAGEAWRDVDPIDGALAVNTGDMMQVWSNDLYKGALHRVLPRTEHERYSIPFFFNPSYDTDYAPLATVSEEGPKYRSINWGQFRQARADGDYSDFGKEIQIADFRTG